MHRLRIFVAGIAVGGLVVGLWAVSGSWGAVSAQAGRRGVNLPGRSVDAPFSDAILAGDTLYLSGRLGLENGQVPDDPQQEARNILDQIQGVLAEAGMTMDAWGNYIIKEFASIRHAPVAFITAKENRNVRKVVNLAQNVFKQSRERVGTGLLNRVVREAILRNRPTVCKNKVPKIYYATQVASQPPTLVMKCNDPTLFTNSWKRYLLGVLQDELPFSEVPIKLYLRAKTDDEHRYPNQHAGDEVPVDLSESEQPESGLAEEAVENS